MSSAPQILRATDRVATPWKNGLGVTREIAVHPTGAGLEDFDWRVSMATVDAGGPFSSFPGIDRNLTVLEGRLSLSVGAAAPVELGPNSPPLAFPGDIPVHAEMIAGPVTDLNVMTRRGRVQATVERLTIDSPIDLSVSETTIIIIRTMGVDLTYQAREHMLEMNDAIFFHQAARELAQLKPRQPSAIFLVRLTSP